MQKRYFVSVILYGVVVSEMFLASKCPLTYSEIVRIIKPRFNPACTIKAYDLQIPDYPKEVNPTPLFHADSVSASGTATGASPSFSADELAS